MMLERSSLKQCFAAICVNILTLSYGCAIGWISAALLELRSSESSPLQTGPITLNEASWIGSILSLGGLTGNIVFVWSSGRFGRKPTFFVMSIQLLISWILIRIATNISYLLVSRFLSGAVGGGLFSVIPIYITEISNENIRGALGTILIIATYLGLLLAFILGNFLKYTLTTYIPSSFILLFFAGFYYLPESPEYINKKSTGKENFKSDDKNISVANDKNLLKSYFQNRIAIKSICIGLLLISHVQLTGCYAMLSYTGIIFGMAGSSLSENMSAIIVGIVTLIGAYVSTILIDRAGRKILLVASSFGTSIGLIILATFSYMNTNKYDIEDFKWIPIASFGALIFTASWGVMSIPYIALPEILPPNIRMNATSVLLSVHWLISFLVSKYFPNISEDFGMHVAIYFFGIYSLLGGIALWILLPETKGKTWDEISKLL